jgi:DNA-binding IclR family transcriptional regulator
MIDGIPRPHLVAVNDLEDPYESETAFPRRSYLVAHKNRLRLYRAMKWTTNTSVVHLKLRPCAVAVAAGTAVGLALPSTRIESEYVGETSEKLVDKAQEVARDAIHRVQSTAQQMGTEGEPRP